SLMAPSSSITLSIGTNSSSNRQKTEKSFQRTLLRILGLLICLLSIRMSSPLICLLLFRRRRVTLIFLIILESHPMSFSLLWTRLGVRIILGFLRILPARVRENEHFEL